jgi:hypothetical protein
LQNKKANEISLAFAFCLYSIVVPTLQVLVVAYCKWLPQRETKGNLSKIKRHFGAKIFPNA